MKMRKTLPSYRAPRLGPAVLLTFGLATFGVSAAGAHEFWIEPSDYSAQVGDRIELRLLVGDGFEHGESYPRNPNHLKSFALDGSSRIPVDGRVGSDPAGAVSLPEAGTLTVSYTSSPTALTLAADPFESYLRDEGLEHISRLRAERGESDRPGREAFARCAKSLVRAGGSSAGFDRVVGLDLEIVAERDPARGTDLPIRVLWHGEPVANIQVRIFHKGTPESKTLRTDAEGRGLVSLSAPGVWLLSAVHMEPAPEASESDWTSTWSSLTFEVAPAP